MTAVTPVTAEGPAGFDAFVAGQSRTLLRSAWLLTGEWTEAEDLVQTALAVTWQRWGALDAPTAYTRRVMMTTFLRWRGRRWTGEVATEEVPEDPDLTDETDRADLRA